MFQTKICVTIEHSELGWADKSSDIYGQTKYWQILYVLFYFVVSVFGCFHFFFFFFENLTHDLRYCFCVLRLNHMFGSAFDTSGARCTDGVWLTARIVNDTMYIIMDFEGLF